MEIRNGRLILYGCGDLLTDYEGIGGYEDYRGDLGLLYLATLPDTGGPVELEMQPVRMRRLQLRCASMEDARWLAEMHHREAVHLGAAVELEDTGRLRLRPT
jgi:poly-gamma-glutamate synthesis protein (capsule biosynthesis protein)